jgi:hypothetical protein
MDPVIIAALENPQAKQLIDNIIETFENPMVSSVAGDISIVNVVRNLIQHARLKHTTKNVPLAFEYISNARTLATMYGISDKQIGIKWPAWSYNN